MDNSVLKPKALGFLIPNLLGVAIVAITKYSLTPYGNSSGSGILCFSEFVIVPMLMGIGSAWFWKGLNLKAGRLASYSVFSVLFAILLCYLFLGEGVICLVIVSPLIFLFVFTGTFMGKAMFNKNNNTLNVSIVAMLLFIFIGDSLSKHQYENEVTDTMVINATPTQIWKNVVSFKKIRQKNTFWLFRMGMPSPMETTVDGNYAGAGRKCIFSNGYVFGEKIVTYEENKNLTFDIIDQPRDPEIMNHIDIERGQFLLKDNGNGTTTLIGNSWYRLYVFPVWYYDTWAQNITRNVHLRVMQHIKELSEK